jgi:hypothetical protein
MGDTLAEKAYVQSKENSAQLADISNNGQIKKIIILSQTEYDAITMPDPDTLYFTYTA